MRSGNEASHCKLVHSYRRLTGDVPMQVDLLSPGLFRQVFEQLDAFEGDAVDPDEAKDGDEPQLTPDERADSPDAAITER